MQNSKSFFEYVLRLGDSCLILSQRLGEWCGHGPILEEDIALTNFALDLLGHARFWLSYAAELEGAGRDEDQLAFLRDTGEFRNLLLVEQENGDFAETIARQFYFDNWYFAVLDSLRSSTDSQIRAIAEKATVATNNIGHFLQINDVFPLFGLFDPINQTWHVQPAAYTR